MFAPQSKHLLVILATSLEFISWLGTGAFPTSDFTNGDATSYLKTFGWLDSNHTNNAVKIRKSMEEFQAFQGIPTTGHLDAGTIEIMKSPRCGVGDKPNGIGDIIFGSPRWRVMNLTYKISKYPTSLQTLGGQDRIDEEIKKAFAVWEAATLFTFTPSTERVDIDIRFESKQHIDGRNLSFDGPAMNLAYASYHPAGVIYFNEEQNWTLGSNQGINFLQVAVHEIGHALGLGHSNIGNALMYPIYIGYMRNFRLHSDDIRGIEALYGSRNLNHARSQPKETRQKRSVQPWEYYERQSEEYGPLDATDGSTGSDGTQQSREYSEMRWNENTARNDEDPLDMRIHIYTGPGNFGSPPYMRRPRYGRIRCPPRGPIRPRTNGGSTGRGSGPVKPPMPMPVNPNVRKPTGGASLAYGSFGYPHGSNGGNSEYGYGSQMYESGAHQYSQQNKRGDEYGRNNDEEFSEESDEEEDESPLNQMGSPYNYGQTNWYNGYDGNNDEDESDDFFG